MPNAVIDAASKHAIDSITRVTWVEPAPKKIGVNALAPRGATVTEGIARAALMLASDHSAWVNGERIAPSCGQRA